MTSPPLLTKPCQEARETLGAFNADRETIR